MPDCTTATCFTRKVCGHYAAGAVLSGEDVVVVVVVVVRRKWEKWEYETI